MGGLRKLRRQMQAKGNLPPPPPKPPKPGRVLGDQAQARFMAEKAIPELRKEVEENKKKAGDKYVPSARDILIEQTLAAYEGREWAPPTQKVELGAAPTMEPAEGTAKVSI
jgi:hypothetical protein